MVMFLFCKHPPTTRWFDNKHDSKRHNFFYLRIGLEKTTLPRSFCKLFSFLSIHLSRYAKRFFYKKKKN